MSHKTSFEQMNATQRSLHNLTHIIDDKAELTYLPAISAAIDQITVLQQQLDKLLPYAEHRHHCPARISDSHHPCVCGLSAVRAEVLVNRKAAQEPASEKTGEVKWAYSYDEENFHGSFDSKDLAVLEGFLNDPEVDKLWVGTYHTWSHQACVNQIGCWDGKRVMEEVVERFLEEAPEWAPDQWGDSLLSKEVCDKVNDFIAGLVMELEKPNWFEMSGSCELVVKSEWEKEVDESDS